MLNACATKSQNETADLNEDQGLKVIVSIPPLQWLVEQIGGDLVQVQSLTVSGDDPHSYEPSPAQMTAVSQADLYLDIQVEFEEVWIPPDFSPTIKTCWFRTFLKASSVSTCLKA